MAHWLADHGLELALALVSGAWFVSRLLVNFGEWRAQHAQPAALSAAEERITREAAHLARDLILKDLTEHMRRIENRLDVASAKSSKTWSDVQAKIGSMELQINTIATLQEERARHE